MTKIDWRTMFKDVLARVRVAGESNEMGARWMATEADNAVHGLLSAKDVEIAKLRDALTAVRGSIKNARGAVESNQVVDKDVHGTLSRAIRMIDAALNGGSDAP